MPLIKNAHVRERVNTASYKQFGNQKSTARVSYRGGEKGGYLGTSWGRSIAGNFTY